MQISVEFIGSVPLTPSLKANGSVRPISTRMVWQGVPKSAMKGLVGDMVKHLGQFQFVVGVLGGVEAILHVVYSIVHDNKDESCLAMMILDFINVFNLVDQETLLREISIKCPAISC